VYGRSRYFTWKNLKRLVLRILKSLLNWNSDMDMFSITDEETGKNLPWDAISRGDCVGDVR